MELQITDLNVSDEYLKKWQSVVDTMAEIIDVPSGLIMRLVKEDIQVFISSKTEGNPYSPGDKEHFKDSGLYCEHVIKTNSMLHIPDALKDENWKENPDVKLNMISYMGFPIHYPDDTPFGTICVLDNKENRYSDLFIRLMTNFKEIIENDLKILYMNQALGTRSRKLIEFISEIKQLRGILRICAHCHKIHDDDNSWVKMETYVKRHSEAEFSHGLCETCMEEIYGNEPWFQKMRKS